MDELISVWQWLEGKRTYIVGVAMIIYGLYVGDTKIVLEGLGLMGLRAGIKSTK